MNREDTPTTDRTWHHTETPTQQPSAAAYRTGCTCTDCRDAHRTYQHEYRHAKAALTTNPDGTTTYHNHKGQPSPTTATTHGCIHPRCLTLAGLTHDPATGLITTTDGTPAPPFGQPTTT